MRDVNAAASIHSFMDGNHTSIDLYNHPEKHENYELPLQMAVALLQKNALISRCSASRIQSKLVLSRQQFLSEQMNISRCLLLKCGKSAEEMHIDTHKVHRSGPLL